MGVYEAGPNGGYLCTLCQHIWQVMAGDVKPWQCPKCQPKSPKVLYLIGSLRNPQIPVIANQLRDVEFDVFDDWYAAGPEADDKWRDYERGRGHSYIEGLAGLAADHVYRFDVRHLDRSDAVILVLPAGRSGHLEFGYSLGKGKPGYILHDDPERWDVMYKFATGVFTNLKDLIVNLQAGKSKSNLRSRPFSCDECQRESQLLGRAEECYGCYDACTRSVEDGRGGHLPPF